MNVFSILTSCSGSRTVSSSVNSLKERKHKNDLTYSVDKYLKLTFKIHSRPPMSRTMKIRKLKLFYFQKNARYRAKELCRNIFLGNLSLNEGKISVGLPVLILEFW